MEPLNTQSPLKTPTHFSFLIGLNAHAEVLSVFIVDHATGLMPIETSRTNDEIRHVEGKESFAIETAWISLRKHEGLTDNPLGIDVTEIGTCEEPVVTTRTKHHPARVCAPVVERFRVFRVSLSHRAALSCRKVKKIEVGLMMPDAELSVVGECVAKEMSIVRGTGEGY